jgi:D-3-phosphoglycerate dehydrogenase
MGKVKLLHLGTASTRMPKDGPFFDGLSRHAEMTVVRNAETLSGSEKASLIRKHEVLLCMWGSAEIPDEVFNDVGEWRYLLNVGGGCPKKYQLHDHGIILSNWGDSPAHGVAEGAFALLLNALKDLPAQTLANCRGETHLPKEKYVSGTLNGTKVAIYGMGMIGRKFAQMLLPFDCEIGYFDPYAEGLPETYRKFDSLESLMDWAEILVVHAAVTPETRHTVDKHMLSKLPDNGVVVSTVIGSVFVEKDLYAEAMSGRLRVGYDVIDYDMPDPAADDPIRHCENITFTWHDVSHFRWPDMTGKLQVHEKVCIENLHRYCAGEKLLWVIDREKHMRMT